MSSGSDQPPSDPKSRRIYWLWAAALALLLAAGLICRVVAVPVWQVRNTLADCSRPWFYGEGVVERLGGPEEALRKLNLYLRMPGWISDYKNGALYVMTRCGEDGRRQLVEILLADKDPRMRKTAAASLGYYQGAGPRIVRALEDAARDRDSEVCRTANEALEQIRQSQEMAKGVPQAEEPGNSRR